MGKSYFQVVLKSPPAMGKIISVVAIPFSVPSVPIVRVGPAIVLVTVLFLPTGAYDDALMPAVSVYGKVQERIRASLQDYFMVKTGTHPTATRFRTSSGSHVTKLH